MVTQVRALMATRNKFRSLNISSHVPPNMSPTCHLFDHFVMKIYIYIYILNRYIRPTYNYHRYKSTAEPWQQVVFL